MSAPFWPRGGERRYMRNPGFTSASQLDPNYDRPVPPVVLMAEKIKDFLSIPAYGPATPDPPLCDEQRQLKNLYYHVKMRDVLVRAGRISLGTAGATDVVLGWDKPINLANY